MGTKTGKYTRHMYDERKRFIGLLVQYGEILPDSDLNDFSQIITRQLQRLAQNVLGDVAVGSSWRINESSTNNQNNFTITGGSGSLDGSGRCWVGGFPCLLVDDKEFESVSVTEPNIHAISTVLTFDTLTDTSAKYEVDELIGRKLIPNIEDTSDGGDPASFDIVGNTETAIEIDTSGGEDMTTVADVGDRYRITCTTFTGTESVSGINFGDKGGGIGGSIGDTTILADDLVVQGKADNFYRYFLVRFTKGSTYTHRITGSSTGTGELEIQPPLAVGVTTTDTFDIIECRYDTVYLDVYLDEISALEDSDLYHDESGTQVEGARRLQVTQRVFVDEGDARVRRLNATYTDADGNDHYTVILANIKREDSVAAIDADHIASPIGEPYGPDAGEGDDGSGSGGSGGLKEDSDLSDLIQEVRDARLGKSDLKTLLIDKVFEEDGTIGLKLGELSDTGSNLQMNGSTTEANTLQLGGGGATIAQFETTLTPASNIYIPTSKAIVDYISSLASRQVILDTGWFRMADISGHTSKRNGVSNRSDGGGGYAGYDNDDFYHVPLSGGNLGKVTTTRPSAGGAITDYQYIISGIDQSTAESLIATDDSFDFRPVAQGGSGNGLLDDAIFDGSVLDLDFLLACDFRLLLRPVIKNPSAPTEFTKGASITTLGKGLSTDSFNTGSGDAQVSKGHWLHSVGTDEVEIGFLDNLDSIGSLNTNNHQLYNATLICQGDPENTPIMDVCYSGDLRLQILLPKMST
jgi:hypothetical protein